MENQFQGPDNGLTTPGKPGDIETSSGKKSFVRRHLKKIVGAFVALVLTAGVALYGASNSDRLGATIVGFTNTQDGQVAQMASTDFVFQLSSLPAVGNTFTITDGVGTAFSGTINEAPAAEDFVGPAVTINGATGGTNASIAGSFPIPLPPESGVQFVIGAETCNVVTTAAAGVDTTTCPGTALYHGYPTGITASAFATLVRSTTWAGKTIGGAGSAVTVTSDTRATEAVSTLDLGGSGYLPGAEVAGVANTLLTPDAFATSFSMMTSPSYTVSKPAAYTFRIVANTATDGDILEGGANPFNLVETVNVSGQAATVEIYTFDVGVDAAGTYTFNITGSVTAGPIVVNITDGTTPTAAATTIRAALDAVGGVTGGGAGATVTLTGDAAGAYVLTGTYDDGGGANPIVIQNLINFGNVTDDGLIRGAAGENTVDNYLVHLEPGDSFEFEGNIIDYTFEVAQAYKKDEGPQYELDVPVTINYREEIVRPITEEDMRLMSDLVDIPRPLTEDENRRINDVLDNALPLTDEDRMRIGDLFVDQKGDMIRFNNYGDEDVLVGSYETQPCDECQNVPETLITNGITYTGDCSSHALGNLYKEKLERRADWLRQQIDPSHPEYKESDTYQWYLRLVAQAQRESAGIESNELPVPPGLDLAVARYHQELKDIEYLLSICDEGEMAVLDYDGHEGSIVIHNGLDAFRINIVIGPDGQYEYKKSPYVPSDDSQSFDVVKDLSCEADKIQCSAEQSAEDYYTFPLDQGLDPLDYDMIDSENDSIEVDSCEECIVDWIKITVTDKEGNIKVPDQTINIRVTPADGFVQGDNVLDGGIVEIDSRNDFIRIIHNPGKGSNLNQGQGGNAPGAARQMNGPTLITFADEPGDDIIHVFSQPNNIKLPYNYDTGDQGNVFVPTGNDIGLSDLINSNLSGVFGDNVAVNNTRSGFDIIFGSDGSDGKYNSTENNFEFYKEFTPGGYNCEAKIWGHSCDLVYTADGRMAPPVQEVLQSVSTNATIFEGEEFDADYDGVPSGFEFDEDTDMDVMLSVTPDEGGFLASVTPDEGGFMNVNSGNITISVTPDEGGFASNGFHSNLIAYSGSLNGLGRILAQSVTTVSAADLALLPSTSFSMFFPGVTLSSSQSSVSASATLTQPITTSMIITQPGKQPITTPVTFMAGSTFSGTFLSARGAAGVSPVGQMLQPNPLICAAFHAAFQFNPLFCFGQLGLIGMQLPTPVLTPATPATTIGVGATGGTSILGQAPSQGDDGGLNPIFYIYEQFGGQSNVAQELAGLFSFLAIDMNQNIIRGAADDGGANYIDIDAKIYEFVKEFIYPDVLGNNLDLETLFTTGAFFNSFPVERNKIDAFANILGYVGRDLGNEVTYRDFVDVYQGITRVSADDLIFHGGIPNDLTEELSKSSYIEILVRLLGKNTITHPEFTKFMLNALAGR